MSVRFDGEVIRKNLWRPDRERIRGVTSDDRGVYTCHECGHVWPRRDRYVWWPIRLRLHFDFRRWFDAWGWQIGADRIEQRVFGRSVRIGPLLVLFGRSDKAKRPGDR